MPIPWAGIIGAGASLLGGALSNRSNKKQVDNTNQAQIEMARETNAMQQGFFDENMGFQREGFERAQFENDRAFSYAKRQDKLNRRDQKHFAKQSTGWAFKDLMDAADSSGIHRLAALGGASGANYSPIQGQAPVNTYNNQVDAPVPSNPQLQTAFMGDIIGPAVNQVTAAYENQLRRERQNARDDVAKRLADAEIRNMEAQTYLTNTQARTIIAKARAAQDDNVVQGPIPARASPQPVGIPQKKVDHNDTVTGYDLFGIRFEPNKGFSDNEDLARRLGDSVADVLGIPTAYNDFVNNPQNYRKVADLVLRNSPLPQDQGRKLVKYVMRYLTEKYKGGSSKPKKKPSNVKKNPRDRRNW